MLGITAIAQSPIAALGGTNANVAVTGIQLTSSIGQQILPNIEVTLGGQQLGFTIGTYSVSASGNVTIITGVDHAIDTSIGSVTTSANANVNVTGSQLTGSLGQSTIIPNSIITVTGNQITSSTNSVTTTGNAVVIPTGIEITGSVGVAFVTAWAVVDPGVTNTWTEVSKGVTNTWTEVDKAA